MNRTSIVLALLALAAVSSAQNFVDGVRGAEWTGITPKTIAYRATVASGFQPYSDTVAMDVSVRGDGSYFYGLIETKPAGVGNDNYDNAIGLQFANIYLDTDPPTGNGSDLGFEITNDRAFAPGVTGYYPNSSAAGLVYARTLGTTYASGAIPAVFEFALPYSYFFNDPQGVGFPVVPATGGDVVFRSLQAYGYAFIGDTTVYGSDRFGRVTLAAPVPEPASLAALGLGAVGLLRRRARKA